jgi:GNAT superfamily N-acetyltransferase
LHKARAYVATEPDSLKVVGFYTLSLTALKPDDTTPEEAQAKFGAWAIPLVYLGQIGVHEPLQRGGGIGSALMTHAFQQTLAIAEIAGTYGMMLDAADEERATWYERLDFFRFDTERDGRIKMICPLTKISQALTGS